MNANTKQTASDVANHLRARQSLIWIVTSEESRVERYLLEACDVAKYIPRTWDAGNGLLTMKGDRLVADTEMSAGMVDPGAALQFIDAMSRPRVSRPTVDRPFDNQIMIDSQEGNGANPYRDRGLWIMRDLGPWLKPPIGLTTQRILRNLARTLPASARERAQAIVILSPNADIPPELAAHCVVIDWPLPDRQEIADLLDAAVNALPDELKAKATLNGDRDKAIDAAVGLSGIEAQACYRKSLVQYRKIDPAIVAAEKKRIVSKSKVIEYYEPLAGGLDSVGGLGVIKLWLAARMTAYSPEARAYGLPAPKGFFVVGMSGCGKSMIAKATATAFQCPLIRWDLGSNKSKFVGESEQNFRLATKTIDALGRCVVWIDEIEKAMSGAINGSADGGVSSDALGTFLTWMQEKQGDSFVIATANDVSQLPPELLRKGRFDEIFFVDLPNLSERKAILEATLKTFGRDPATIDLQAVALPCEGFTGSELAALIPDALYIAFADKARAITTDDLLEAARTVTPLSSTARERINALRKWAIGRARPATLPELETVAA
jgi:hypothetical protein